MTESSVTESSVVVRVLADYTTGLCLRCVAAFGRITIKRAEDTSAELVRARGVVSMTGRCSVCTAEGTVYRLG
jgi:hypothetical protein